MKNRSNLRLILILFALFPLFSCRTAPQVQAYREDGLPVWVEQVFSNPSGIWAGFNDEKGFYASGEANYGDLQSSLSAAELDAKTRLQEFVCRELSKEKPAVLLGVQRVDRFIAENGSVYVLVFVSQKNAKKSLKNNSFID